MCSEFISFKGLRLLIVDDDFDTRVLLAMLFESNEAEVITAGSAKEALEIMSFSQPDILISDICLPDEDGYSLIKKIRTQEIKKGRKIPAIALTAFTKEGIAEYAYLVGFDNLQYKPVDLDQLIYVVASLLGVKQCA